MNRIFQENTDNILTAYRPPSGIRDSVIRETKEKRVAEEFVITSMSDGTEARFVTEASMISKTDTFALEANEDRRSLALALGCASTTQKNGRKKGFR
jgi:hypothetical protein